MVKFGCLVSEICERTDRQTYSLQHVAPVPGAKLLYQRNSDSDCCKYWIYNIVSAYESVLTGSSKGEVSRQECIEKIAASVNYVHSQTANVITGTLLIYAFLWKLMMIFVFLCLFLPVVECCNSTLDLLF